MTHTEPTRSTGAEDLNDLWTGDFEYTAVRRDGHVLEVTIDRSDRYNALHGPAHHELHEIFNASDKGPDLWVAILTGAGDKAFCSGNDLKATSEGLDILPGPTGFGGICDRWGREKPIIAAVNGVAMGAAAKSFWSRTSRLRMQMPNLRCPRSRSVCLQRRAVCSV